MNFDEKQIISFSKVIKLVKLDDLNPKQIDDTMHEIAILSSIQHQNIVKVI